MKHKASKNTVTIVLCLIVIAALAGHSIHQYRQYGYYMREQQELVKSARDSAVAARTYIEFVLEEGVQERTIDNFEIAYGAFCSMDSLLYAINIDGSDANSDWAAYASNGFRGLGMVMLGHAPIPGTEIQAPFWADGVIDKNERLFLKALSDELLYLQKRVDATNDANYSPQMDPKQFSALAQGILDQWSPYLDNQEETVGNRVEGAIGGDQRYEA